MLSLKDERVCIVGDFNCIKDDLERANYVYRRLDTIEFNHFIDNSNLLDLALFDSQFTWFAPLGKKCRLDRELVNDTWWSSGDGTLKSLKKKVGP